MTEWKPIETAPKDLQPIILYMPYLDEPENYQIGYWNSGRWENCIDSMYELKPTHWMPLPIPPKKKHCCGNKYWKCISSSYRQEFELHHDDTYINCMFCPFCGEKADD